MAQTIIHKRSGTSGKVPAAAQLKSGELAINVPDSKVFIKNSSGEVVDIVANATSIAEAALALAKTKTTESASDSRFLPLHGTADNAAKFGGILPANYARTDVAEVFNKGILSNTTRITDQDFDDLTKSGHYNLHSLTGDNGPTGVTDGTLIVTGSNGEGDTSCTQTVTNSATNQTHVRTKGAEAWSAWNQAAFLTDVVASASKLKNARTIALHGDATGSIQFDGSSNQSINVVIKDDSHNHVIANIDGLTTALASKVDKANPVVTGPIILPGNNVIDKTFSMNENEEVQYILLCLDAKDNDVSGTVRLNRTSAHSQSAKVDVIVSSNSAGIAGGVVVATQVQQNGERYELVHVTVSDVKYVALKYSGNAFPANTLSVFSGYRKTTGNSNIVAVLPAVISGESLVDTSHSAFQVGASRINLGGDRVFTDGYHPTADRLTNDRTITLNGDVSGSVVFNGTANKTLTVTVKDDSHNHVLSNVDGLVDALAAKATPADIQAAVDGITNGAAAAFDTLKEIQDAMATDGELASAISAINLVPNATKLNTARTISLAGDATGSITFDGSANKTLTVVIKDDSHAHSFKNLKDKMSGTDSYGTTRHLSSGVGTGGAALTINDGYGNANLTFNHTDGIPEVDGSSGRIEFSKDSVVGTMAFGVINSVSKGVVTDVLTQFVITTNYSQFNTKLIAPTFEGALTGNASTASKLAVAHSINLSGDATGSVTFDGSSARTITVTVKDSELLNGYAPKTDSTGDSAAIRTSDGDVIARLLRSEYHDESRINGSIAFRVEDGVNTDNHIRFCNSASAVRAWLSTYSKTESNARYLGISTNAVSSSKWATARTITLAGDASGNVSIDGSANKTLNVVIKDNSHNHSSASGNFNTGGWLTEKGDSVLAKHSLVADDDLNTITRSGLYSLTDGVLNVPWSSNGATVQHNQWQNEGADQVATQLFYPYNTNRTFFRRKSTSGTTWQGWIEQAYLENTQTWDNINSFTKIVNANGGVNTAIVTNSTGQLVLSGGVKGYWGGVAIGRYNGSTLKEGTTTRWPLVSQFWDWTDNTDPTDLRFVIQSGNKGGLTSYLDLVGFTSVKATKFVGAFQGNADTATKLKTARTIALSGDATGSITFDGTANKTITVNVKDSEKLAGKSASTADGASTVAVRNGSGDITTRLFRSTYDNNAGISGAIAYRINSTTDNYTRYCSDKAAIQVWLNVYSRNEGDARYLGIGANAVSAAKLATARTISLAGDATGSISFDGTGNKTLTVAVKDDSHNHIMSNIDGLVTALAGKVSTTGTAANANKLDNIDSSQFLRSDTNDYKTGGMTQYNDNIYFRLGTGGDVEHFWNGSNYYTDINGGGNWYIRDGNSANTTRFTFDVDTGILTATKFVGAFQGNADTATKLKTARSITLNGDASGAVTFDGSANKTLTVAIDGTKHGHDTQYLKVSMSGSYTGTIDRNGGQGWIRTTKTGLLPYSEDIASSIGTSSWNFGGGYFTTLYEANVSLSDKYLGKGANAVSASKLKVAHSINLSGDATGSVTFDGSKAVSLSVSIKDDSHNHVISNIDGLVTALAAKATPADIQEAVDGITGGAAAAYDTLKEIQNAMATDGELASAISAITVVPKANRLTNARTISLGGDASGSMTFDGSANKTITVSVKDNSHNHSSSTGAFNAGGVLSEKGDRVVIRRSLPSTTGGTIDTLSRTGIYSLLNEHDGCPLPSHGAVVHHNQWNSEDTTGVVATQLFYPYNTNRTFYRIKPTSSGGWNAWVEQAYLENNQTWDNTNNFTKRINANGGIETNVIAAKDTTIIMAPSAKGFWGGLQVATPDSKTIKKGTTTAYPRMASYWDWTNDATPTDLRFVFEAGNTAGLASYAYFKGFSYVKATKFVGAFQGNADTATKLKTARTITIAGDATGSTTFDGTANKTITVNVTDSEKLAGKALSSGANKNTVALRDSSGNISTVLFKSSYGNDAGISGAMAYRVNTTTNSYIRFCSDGSKIRTWLSLYSKAEADGRYITNTAYDGFGSNKLHEHFTGDLDTIKRNSIYCFQNTTTTNIPSGINSWGFVNTLMYSQSSGYATQIVTSMNSGYGETYMRHLNNGVWSSWYSTGVSNAKVQLVGDVTGTVQFDRNGLAKVTTVVGNDTHTHNNSYYTKSQGDGRYLKLSGGTVTGNLSSKAKDLSGAINFNSYIVNAEYTLFGVAAGSNGPASVSYGTLSVIGNGSGTLRFITQTVVEKTTNAMYVRTRTDNSAAWAAWTRIYSDSYHPKADKLTTGRTITIAGDATGSTTFDGGTNRTITVNVKDSEKLGGKSPNSSSVANTVAVRDGSSDVSARLFRSSYAAQSTISGAMAFRVNTTGDNYIRFCSDKAAIRTWLETYSKTESNAKFFTLSAMSGYMSNGYHASYHDDLDDLATNGIWNFASDCANCPEGITSWGFIQVYIHAGGTAHRTQVATSMNSGTGKMYMRNMISGTWSEWVTTGLYNAKVSITGDASGSGNFNANGQLSASVVVSKSTGAFKVNGTLTVNQTGTAYARVLNVVNTSAGIERNNTGGSLTFHSDTACMLFAGDTPSKIITGLGYNTSSVENAIVAADNEIWLLPGQQAGYNSSKRVKIATDGKIYAPAFVGKLVGNADTVTKWKTARKITLSGDASGNVTLDGNSNQTLNVTVSHRLVKGSINGTTTKLETITTSGTYAISNEPADKPDIGLNGGCVQHNQWGSEGSTQVATQIAFPYSANRTFFRRKSKSGAIGTAIWESWIEQAYLENTQSWSGTNTFTKTISGSVSGNAGTATKLKSARTISLTGNATGSVSFDGSKAVSISVTVASIGGVGINSLMRSDTNDYKTAGMTQFNDNIYLKLGTGGDVEHFWNGSHYYTDINGGANWYIRDGNSSNATRFTLDADIGAFTATGQVSGANLVSRGTTAYKIDIRRNASEWGLIRWHSKDATTEYMRFGVTNSDTAVFTLNKNMTGNASDTNYVFANNGDFTAPGNVTMNSDIRLKKNIEVIDNALDKVKAIRGVVYDRKDVDLRQAGVIAQEVQKVLPEVVIPVINAETKEETLTVAYGNMVGLLVEAIKEQDVKYTKRMDAQAEQIAKQADIIAKQQLAIDKLLEKLV